ncbi:MAG: DUF2125 domain-containing protein [Rhodoplanes sp.]
MQMRPVNEVSWLPPPPSRSRRLRWIAPPVLLLLLSVGYIAWWLYAASEFRQRTLAWIEDRRADGWRMDYTDVTRRGFPLKLGLRFDKPVVAAPDAAWRWSASRVLLSMPVFGGRSVRLAIKGDQAIEFVGPSVASAKPRRYSGRAEKFAFDLLPGGWMPNGRLSIRHLTMTGEGPGESLALPRLDLVSRGDPAAATDPTVSTYAVQLSAHDMRLPEYLTLPLCGEIAHLALDAKLLGGLDPKPWPDALAKLRDEGGAIEATRLVLACGRLTVNGEGTFALDPAGQPIGAMTARIQGYEAALDELAADKAIPAHTAAAAKILLRAMARSGGEGVPVLSAPVSIQDRTMSVGPVALLKVGAIGWLNGGGKTR